MTVFDGIMLILFLLFAITGIRQGFLHSVSGLVSILLASLLAPSVGSMAMVWIGTQTAASQEDTMIHHMVVIGISFLVLLIIGSAVMRILTALVHLPGLKFLNRILGGIFGALQGGVLILLICALANFWIPEAEKRIPQFQPEMVTQSSVYQFVEEKNPFLFIYQNAMEWQKEMREKI